MKKQQDINCDIMIFEKSEEMKLQITIRNLKQFSKSIREKLHEKVEWLETFCDQIMTCRVVVDAPHLHHHEGVLYNVLIELRVPGAELLVKRQPREDIDVAIWDAFDAARRDLRIMSGNTGEL